MTTFKHLTLTTDDQQIIWLGLNIAGKSINLLNRDVLDELERVCAHINQPAQKEKLKALILFSEKTSNFCSGTDVEQLLIDTRQQQTDSIIQRAQALLRCFAELPIPTLAMINGTCVSAGLELAMMLDYRIANDHPRTRFGFPDIKLGLHSAFGGIERAVQLIGNNKALGMMVQGQLIDTQTALRFGLIDHCVSTDTDNDNDHLKQTALSFLQQHLHKASNKQKSLPNKLKRTLSVRYFRHALRHTDKHASPAPFAILDLWEQYDGNRTQLQRAETQSASALLLLRSTQNRIRNFLARRRLRKASQPTIEGTYTPKHIHVIGAGAIGTAIAHHIQQCGFNVSLQDKREEALALAKSQNSELLIDAKGRYIPKADVIVEAITENLSAKQDIFAIIEDSAKPDALLATASISLSIRDIAAPMLQPKRLVGMHFFKPIDTVQLVEISATGYTDPLLMEQAAAFAHQLQRIPLFTKDTPGRLICRILLAYVLQGIRLYQQHVPPSIIDKAGVDFGMPLGPLEMADQMGLDTCWRIGEAIAKPSDIELPYKLGEMVREGKLGVKSGTGFYRYRNGRRLKTEKHSWDGDIPTMQDKLVRQMRNEASICLEAGVIDDPLILDAAMVLGAGYPEHHNSLINN